MAINIDAAKIERELQQRLNNRMDSVRELVKSRQAVAEAREALNAAENEDVQYYMDALNAGWTADELRASGLPEPEKKLRVRKRAVKPKPAVESDDDAETVRLKALAARKAAEFKQAAEDKKAALDAAQTSEHHSSE